MSERIYDRLSNVFMLMAVFSALTFSSLGRWSWVAGVVGGAAGAAAVVLYFTNLSKNTDKGEDVQAVPSEDTRAHRQEPLIIEESWMVELGVKGLEQYIQAAYSTRVPKAVRFYEHRRLLQRRAVNVYWHTYHEAVMQMAEQREEITLSSEQIASCAIEIIRALSSGEDRDRWEFNFGPRGLLVSPAKRIKDRTSIEDRSTTGETEYESGRVPTTIQ